MIPEGQNIRKAVQWISDELLQDSTKNKLRLVNEASIKFALTPKESNQLLQFYLNSPE